MGLTFRTLIFYLLLSICSFSSQANDLSILQFNIWQEGTVVENGFNAIVENIIEVNPDMITFSEVRNYNQSDFITRLITELKKKGVTYYGESSVSTGIISKYPIIEQTVVYPYVNDQGSVLKAIIEVKDKTIVLYSAHLDYKHYASYLPRGYNGITWEKLKEPITDPYSILNASRKSHRLEAIEAILADAKKEILRNHIIIIGGDFNEPSHYDWTENTKYLYNHNGAVVKWDCSILLYENGFKDSYREHYPNVANYPGFTFPSDNISVPVSKLTWAPDVDERERIDFIYFYPNQNITLKEAFIVGPSSSIVCSQRVEEQSNDKFISPVSIWPTDHKAVLSTFIIK